MITINQESVLAALDPDDGGTMVHDIARRLRGTAAYDSLFFHQINLTLYILKRRGLVRSLRPAPTMQKRWVRVSRSPP